MLALILTIALMGLYLVHSWKGQVALWEVSTGWKPVKFFLYWVGNFTSQVLGFLLLYKLFRGEWVAFLIFSVLGGIVGNLIGKLAGEEAAEAVIAALTKSKV